MDDDIDPANLFDVVWAMSTRCDPAEDIDLVHRAWSGPLDPRKRKGETYNSSAVIVACRPYEWMKDFAPVAESSPELRAKTLQKWGHLLRGAR